jgi:hypothetical protein
VGARQQHSVVVDNPKPKPIDEPSSSKHVPRKPVLGGEVHHRVELLLNGPDRYGVAVCEERAVNRSDTNRLAGAYDDPESFRDLAREDTVAGTRVELSIRLDPHLPYQQAHRHGDPGKRRIVEESCSEVQ